MTAPPLTAAQLEEMATIAESWTARYGGERCPEMFDGDDGMRCNRTAGHEGLCEAMGTIERDEAEKIMAALPALLAAARERDRLRADYAAIAHAVGVEYTPEGHANVPGPVEDVVRAITDLYRTGKDEIDRLHAERRAQGERVAKLEAVAEAARRVCSRSRWVAKQFEDALAALDATTKGTST